MKDYIKRLKTDSKKIELVWWWLLRLVMVGGIIDSTFVKRDVQQSLQMAANMVGMFAWEICMATSKRCTLRHLPSYIQDFGAPGFFLASFGGAYLDFYYSIPNYDVFLHLVGGAAGVWFGYEIVTAMQKRDKSSSNLPILLLAAFGFSFILGNAWELFEFTFDQVAGGDAQHWSLELALEAALKHDIDLPNILHPLNDMRYALIDTMEDMICNTAGAIVMYIVLKKIPYHHRGKNDVNAQFAAEREECVK